MASLENKGASLDYSKYLGESWSPNKHANELLLEVNGPQDQELDIGTCLNKLKFDKDDISVLIKDKILSTEGLTSHLDSLAVLDKKLDDRINPAAQQLQRSFDRIDQSILKPYEQCVSIHMALKKIHSTNKLLRGASFWLYLMSKIEEIEINYNNGTESLKSMLSLSLLIKQAQIHLDNSGYLSSLKSINEQTASLKKLKLQLEQRGASELKKLGSYTTSTRNTTIIFQNSSPIIKDERLLGQLFSLMNNLNSQVLITSITEIFKETVNQSVQLMLKNLNNAKQLPMLIRSMGTTVDNLDRIERCIKSSLNSDVWKDIGDKLELQNGMNVKFWVEFSINTEIKFKQAINKGGPIARGLKSVSEDIENAINDTVIIGGNTKLIVLNAFKIK